MDSNAEIVQKPQPINDHWLFDLAKQDFECHLSAMGRLQTRVGIVFGFSFALFGLVINVLKDYHWNSAVVPISAIILAWVFLWICYRASTWPTGASAARIIRVLCERIPWAQFRDEGIASYHKSTKEIRERQLYRGKLFTFALFFLMIASVTTAIAVFINLPIR